MWGDEGRPFEPSFSKWYDGYWVKWELRRVLDSEEH